MDKDRFLFYKYNKKPYTFAVSLLSASENELLSYMKLTTVKAEDTIFVFNHD